MGTEIRTHAILVRLTPGEKQRFDERASSMGKHVADMVRTLVLRRDWDIVREYAAESTDSQVIGEWDTLFDATMATAVRRPRRELIARGVVLARTDGIGGWSFTPAGVERLRSER